MQYLLMIYQNEVDYGKIDACRSRGDWNCRGDRNVTRGASDADRFPRGTTSLLREVASACAIRLKN